jgi:hypothetical protein
MIDLLNYSPIASSYQALAGANGVAALVIPATAALMVVKPEGDGTRYRDDGTAATDTVGVPLASGDAEPFMGASMRAVSIWVDTSTTLHVSYYSRNR